MMHNGYLHYLDRVSQPRLSPPKQVLERLPPPSSPSLSFGLEATGQGSGICKDHRLLIVGQSRDTSMPIPSTMDIAMTGIG